MVDIVKDSFHVTDQVPALFNHLTYRHTQDYIARMAGPWAEPGWRSLLAVPDYVDDAASIAQYSLDPGRLTPIPGPLWLLPMVRGKNRDSDYDGYAQGTATAHDVVTHVLRRHLHPPRQVTFTVGVIGLNLDLGDVIRVTHFAGIGAEGWIARPLRIIAHDSDPGQKSVTITAVDLRPIFDETP
jgi:hypothetical protein